MCTFHAKLLERVRSATDIVALTGAGVSAESGIPTFRDAMSGLWAKFKPQELATPEAFALDPQRVSRWYDERRLNVGACRPNPGHVALAQWEQIARAAGRRFTLITQNVDRLHQAAGSTNVIELHGTLWVWRCVDCGAEVEERGPAFAEYPPRCACGGMRRPGVVWFNEMLPAAALSSAQAAAGRCDLFLSLGTSSVVYPAAGLIDLARREGAITVEINPEETAASENADWSIRGKCGEVLPLLVTESYQGMT